MCTAAGTGKVQETPSVRKIHHVVLESRQVCEEFRNKDLIIFH